MLGELFCQLGTQMLQKIHDPKMNMAQSCLKPLYRRNWLDIHNYISSRRAAYGRSPAEIVGSNPTGSMDICLL